jgi:hypothetical protein
MEIGVCPGGVARAASETVRRVCPVPVRAARDRGAGGGQPGVLGARRLRNGGMGGRRMSAGTVETTESPYVSPRELMKR